MVAVAGDMAGEEKLSVSISSDGFTQGRKNTEGKESESVQTAFAPHLGGRCSPSASEGGLRDSGTQRTPTPRAAHLPRSVPPPALRAARPPSLGRPLLAPAATVLAASPPPPP